MSTQLQNDDDAKVEAALQMVREQIRELEIRYQRLPNSVQLLAVSKKKPLSAVLAAITAGQRAFGENYPDEGVEKIRSCRSWFESQGKTADFDCEWHFIGGIQSRKAATIAEHFAWVHSVDRLKVAEKLSAKRPADMPPINICLQVNIDQEESKSGVALDEIPALAEACNQLPNLCLRGLMAIPAPRPDVASQRGVFATLRGEFERLKKQYPSIDTLSMGMSGDLEAAIAEGSSMVRVGTSIFGAR